MADYVLSNQADEDLADIYLYSYGTFGEAQADVYFLALRDCLQMLANNPRIGRAADYLRPGLLWHRHARHVVFYLIEETGIFIVRVLHDSMDMARHVGMPDGGA